MPPVTTQNLRGFSSQPLNKFMPNTPVMEDRNAKKMWERKKMVFSNTKCSTIYFNFSIYSWWIQVRGKKGSQRLLSPFLALPQFTGNNTIIGDNMWYFSNSMLPKITELVPVKVAMLERLHTYLSISMLFGYRSAFFLGKIELETLLTRSFTLVKLPTALPNEIFLFIPSGFKLHHVAFFFTLYLDHNPSMMRMRAKSHLDARLAGPVLKTTGLTKKKKKSV